MVRMRAWLTCGTAVVSMLTTGAAGQQSPRTERVEVAGQRPAVISLPDRQVFTIERDLQSTTGSVSDVLRNLPSVEVDVQGNVSLRGDANVTILIDGKTSALLAGNAAEALEQIPAETVAQIEVITNPSAEFKREGSGGIINIITKKNAMPGTSGSARANVGNDGRYNLSASAATKFGRYTFSGGAGFRRDVRRHSGEETRERADGQDSQRTWDKNRRETVLLRAGAEAQITDRDRLELLLRSRLGSGRIETSERNITRTGALLTESERFGTGPGKRHDLDVQVEYVHTFATKGEELKLEASRGFDWEEMQIDFTTTSTGGPGTYDLLRTNSTELRTEAGADYVLPFADGSKLKAGYAYESERNDYDNLGEVFDASSGSWIVDTNLTNRFLLDQAVHAFYATYETKFGKLGVLPGLRLEQTWLTTELRNLGQVNDSSYFRVYPTIHLTYGLSDSGQLRMSYSRRINRPDDEDLNASRRYRDAFNLSAGNPDLKPEETDAVEAGYHHTGEKLDVLVTGFWRSTRNGFTEVSRYISDTVLLTTNENVGRSLRTGLELTSNADVAADLSVQVNASLFYNEIDPGLLGIGRFRSGLAWSGKLKVDYRLTPDDQFQLSAGLSARQLTPQGYRLPSFNGSAAYRHAFTPNLAGVFTVMNLFDSQKNKTVLDSGALQDVSIRRHPGRVIFAGLVYTFGGAREESEAPEQAE